MDKLFIRKAHEKKIVEDSTLMRDAVLNALANGLRKKGAKFKSLWNKKQQPLDKELASANLSLVEEVEEAEGKSWVDLIYDANGQIPSE